MPSESRKALLLYISIIFNAWRRPQRLFVLLPKQLKLFFIFFVNFQQEFLLWIIHEGMIVLMGKIQVLTLYTYKICFVLHGKLPMIFELIFDVNDILQMKDNEPMPESQLLSPQVDPRLIIYKEIQTYRSKLSEYQLLEKELNQLNLHLQNKEPAQNDQRRLARAKSDRGKASENLAKRNSHKKIKIYELQKKYDRAAREKEQKRNIFDKNMEHNNKITWQIEELSSKIQSQKKSTENLKQLQLQIEGDLEVTSSKIEEEVNNLQTSAKEKQLCNYERKKIRDSIKRTRMVIHNLNNNLTEDLELSYSDEDQRNLLKSDTSQPLAETVPHATDLQIWMEKQTKRIQDYFARYESSHQKNESYMSDFYALKKEMLSNELLVKHHKVTIALQTAKIKEYDKLIQKYRQNIAKRNEIGNQIALKINNLDGQRGYMRGSIGVKIQEQRLVKAVNALLEQDIKKVRDKLGYLIFLKTLVEKRTL